MQDHLYLLGVTPEEQRLLPDVAAELCAHENRLLSDPYDRRRAAEVIAEIAARVKSPAHLEALSALLNIAASYTENPFEQEQRIAWDRVFYDRSGSSGFASADVPPEVSRTIAVAIAAYTVRTGRLSRFLQEADGRWKADGRRTIAPEHEVDSFLGLATRRYLLEVARIIRFIASDHDILAIQKIATQVAGLDLRLP